MLVHTPLEYMQLDQFGAAPVVKAQVNVRGGRLISTHICMRARMVRHAGGLGLGLGLG